MDIGPRNLLNLSCFFSHLDFEVCEVQSKPTCKTNVSSADLLFDFEAGHSQTPFGSPHFVDLQLLRKFSCPFSRTDVDAKRKGAGSMSTSPPKRGLSVYASRVGQSCITGSSFFES